MLTCCWYIWQTMQLKGFLAAGIWLQSLYVKPVFWLILLLLPLNWTIEALKWQLLTGQIEKADFLQALRSVISGLTLGLVVPHSFGDFAGRTLQMKGKNRFESVGALLVNNLSAYLVVMLFGFPAYFVYLLQVQPNNILLQFLYGILAIAVFIIGIAGYFNAVAFLKLQQKYLRWKWIDKYLGITGLYSRNLLYKILALALTRYLVFGTQFGLMLFLAGIKADWYIIGCGVAAVYVVKSSVPGLTLVGDLGLREFSAVLFFKAFAIRPEPVVMASLGIWGVNILLPALLGLVFLTGIKISVTNTTEKINVL